MNIFYRFNRLIIYTLCALLLLSLFSVLFTEKVNAVTAGEWRAGRIIDDAVFYNKDSMTAQQVQQFLDAKVPTCDRWRASTSASYQPPWTCLKEYQENTVTKENNIGRFNANGTPYNVPGGKLAGQIIWDVAQEYGINPQVLIVMLQKEQGLITDNWPWRVQYQKAMGYACPDTAPCDAQYYGFYNQVSSAAWQLKRYIAYPYKYNFQAGVSRYIQYSPNAACGGTEVFIENPATAALYNYTPYQPNAGALANMYGTANCGAYGNRNFWRYFNDWFGSTYGEGFRLLTTPRWMQIKNEGTKKVYVYTGEPAGDGLAAGRQIRFLDKILINGKWYLRTEFNYKNGDLYAIDQNNVEEIPYQAITPKWVTLSTDANRSYPAARTSVGSTLVKGTSVKVVDQITVDGNLYYRTEYSKNNNQGIGIHSRFVTDFTPIPLESPRNFCTNIPTSKIDPTTNTKQPEQPKGMFFINKKTLVNGVWYFQEDIDNSTSLFIDSGVLRSVCFTPFDNPRNLKLSSDVTRFNPYTNEKYDTLKKGTVINFSSKIFMNNQWYYRTANNTLNNVDAVISASSTTEL